MCYLQMEQFVLNASHAESSMIVRWNYDGNDKKFSVEAFSD